MRCETLDTNGDETKGCTPNQGESGQCEDRLLGDGMGCSLDGGENLRSAIGIEFVPIELHEQRSANFGG